MKLRLFFGMALIFIGVIFAILDVSAGILGVFIALGSLLILKSIIDVEPEDEKFMRLRDRSLANSWIITAILISAIYVTSEILELKLDSSIFVLVTLMSMLITAVFFRIYYEKKGDVN